MKNIIRDIARKFMSSYFADDKEEEIISAISMSFMRTLADNKDYIETNNNSIDVINVAFSITLATFIHAFINNFEKDKIDKDELAETQYDIYHSNRMKIEELIKSRSK